MRRPACFSVADRRVSKLRPSDSQPCRRHVSNRSGRQSRSDRLLRTKRKACPVLDTGARSVLDVQRLKRSTPTRRTGARRVKDQRQTSTAGLSQGRRINVNSVDSARAGCEGPTSNSASPAFPRGRPFDLTRATGITHPGFYGRKPWKKPNSAPIIAAPATHWRGSTAPLRNIAAKVFTTKPARSRPSLPPPQAHRQDAPGPPQQLLPLQRSPRVVERCPAPVDLPAPVEATQRLLLRRQRHPVFLEQRQFHHQEPLPGRKPLQTLPVAVVRVLQPPPLDDQRPRLAEYLLVVLGRLPRRQVGVLPTHRRLRRGFPAPAGPHRLPLSSGSTVGRDQAPA